VNNIEFNDIQLIPEYCDFDSIKDVDITTKFCDSTFSCPFFVKTDIISKAKLFSQNNILYCYTNSDNRKFIQLAVEEDFDIISVGVDDSKESFEFIQWLSDECYTIDYLVINAKNAHKKIIRNLISHCQTTLVDNMPKIIAGDIASLSAANDLKRWGVDGMTVGINDNYTNYKNFNFSTLRSITDIKMTNDDMSSMEKRIADDMVKEIDYAKSNKFEVKSEFIFKFLQSTSITKGMGAVSKEIFQEELKRRITNELKNRKFDIISSFTTKTTDDIVKSIVGGAKMITVVDSFDIKLQNKRLKSYMMLLGKQNINSLQNIQFIC
jgi:hypothetical protein